MKIYIDTREKFPWNFTFYGFEEERLKLTTGDYYVEEIPDLVIERKRTSGEIAINLGQKWKQFESELVRMSTFKHPYIICEFPEDYIYSFPINSGIPSNKIQFIKMNSTFLANRLFQNCRKYNINIEFCENSEEAQNLVLEIINNNGKIRN